MAVLLKHKTSMKQTNKVRSKNILMAVHNSLPYARVFVTVSHFHPSLIFAGATRRLEPISGSIIRTEKLTMLQTTKACKILLTAILKSLP